MSTQLAGFGARAATGDRTVVAALDLAVDRARVIGDWQAVNEGLEPIAFAARDGSEQALSLLLGLVDGHRLALPAIQRLLTDPHQVEEAAQSTLVAVSRGISGFEGRSRFTSWLYTVSSNEARQLIRREARRPVPAEGAALEIDPGMRHMSSILIDRVRIDDAIAGLDEPYRSTIILRESEGLSYEQIADRLGVEVGTVRSRLARGRERLAEALGLG